MARVPCLWARVQAQPLDPRTAARAAGLLRDHLVARTRVHPPVASADDLAVALSSVVRLRCAPAACRSPPSCPHCAHAPAQGCGVGLLLAGLRDEVEARLCAHLARDGTWLGVGAAAVVLDSLVFGAPPRPNRDAVGHAVVAGCLRELRRVGPQRRGGRGDRGAMAKTPTPSPHTHASDALRLLVAIAQLHPHPSAHVGGHKPRDLAQRAVASEAMHCLRDVLRANAHALPAEATTHALASLVRFGLSPPVAVVERLASLADALTVPQVKRVLWACATAGHHEPWVHDVAEAVCARLADHLEAHDERGAWANAEGLVRSLWAVARVVGPDVEGSAEAGRRAQVAEQEDAGGGAVSDGVVERVVRGTDRLLAERAASSSASSSASASASASGGRLQGRDLTNVVWAFSRLRWQPSPLVQALVQDSIAPTVAHDTVNALGIAKLLWSFAHLGLPLRPDALRALCARVERAAVAGEFTLRQLGTTLWALAVLRACGQPGVRAVFAAARLRLQTEAASDIVASQLMVACQGALLDGGLHSDSAGLCDDVAWVLNRVAPRSKQSHPANNTRGVSEVHRSVARCARALGWEVRSEVWLGVVDMCVVDLVLLPRGRADLTDSEAAVVVEVDGPCHFLRRVRNDQRQGEEDEVEEGLVLDGATRLKHAFLADACGVRVLSVPAFVWTALEPWDAKVAWLQRRLAGVVGTGLAPAVHKDGARGGGGRSKGHARRQSRARSRVY